VFGKAHFSKIQVVFIPNNIIYDGISRLFFVLFEEFNYHKPNNNQ